MTDFFRKGAEMTKKVPGIAKIKGATHINPRPPMKITRIAEITDGKDAVARLLLEVASTDEERRRGMMGRSSLPPVCGMMFDGLDEKGFFWMKNCLIPLDLMFLDADGFVTKVFSMPVDKDGTRRYYYDEDDAAAIEAASGFCERFGIEPGFKVETKDIRRKQ